MSQCNLCPLASKHQIYTKSFEKQPKLIVVGEFPNREDEKLNKPFSNYKDGEPVIKSILKAMNIDLSEVYFTYALKCNPFSKGLESKPSFIKTCRYAHLEKELSSINTPYILCMGNVAIEAILPEEDLGLAESRGSWYTTKIGNKDRLVRTTFSYQQVAKMSMWHLDKFGDRDKRWNPTGSVGWFFIQDIKAVVSESHRTS